MYTDDKVTRNIFKFMLCKKAFKIKPYDGVNLSSYTEFVTSNKLFNTRKLFTNLNQIYSKVLYKSPNMNILNHDRSTRLNIQNYKHNLNLDSRFKKQNMFFTNVITPVLHNPYINLHNMSATQ
jgi:hypothetical protein